MSRIKKITNKLFQKFESKRNLKKINMIQKTNIQFELYEK
jgi:hypothetical protein